MLHCSEYQSAWASNYVTHNTSPELTSLRRGSWHSHEPTTGSLSHVFVNGLVAMGLENFWESLQGVAKANAASTFFPGKQTGSSQCEIVQQCQWPKRNKLAHAAAAVSRLVT